MEKNVFDDFDKDVEAWFEDLERDRPWFPNKDEEAPDSTFPKEYSTVTCVRHKDTLGAQSAVSKSASHTPVLVYTCQKVRQKKIYATTPSVPYIVQGSPDMRLIEHIAKTYGVQPKIGVSRRQDGRADYAITFGLSSDYNVSDEKLASEYLDRYRLALTRRILNEEEQSLVGMGVSHIEQSCKQIYTNYEDIENKELPNIGSVGKAHLFYGMETEVGLYSAQPCLYFDPEEARDILWDGERPEIAFMSKTYAFALKLVTNSRDMNISTGFAFKFRQCDGTDFLAIYERPDTQYSAVMISFSPRNIGSLDESREQQKSHGFLETLFGMNSNDDKPEFATQRSNNCAECNQAYEEHIGKLVLTISVEDPGQ